MMNVTHTHFRHTLLGLGAIAALVLVAAQAQAAASLFLVVQKSANTLILQASDGKVYIVDSEPCPVANGDSVAVDTNLDGGPEVAGKVTKGARYFNTTCSIWNSRPISQRITVTKGLSNDEQFLGVYAGQSALVSFGPGCGLSIKNYERQDIYLALSNDKFDAVNDMIILPNGNTCAVTEVTIIDGRSVSAATCPANSVRHPTDKKLCVCDVGFLPDADGVACVGTPLLCPAHSTLVSGVCQCDQGYISKNNRCMTESAACQYEHGANADGNRSQCWCKAGYHFGSNNQCVRDSGITPSSSTVDQPRLRQTRCPYGTVRQPDTNLCWPAWY